MEEGSILIGGGSCSRMPRTGNLSSISDFSSPPQLHVPEKHVTEVAKRNPVHPIKLTK